MTRSCVVLVLCVRRCGPTGKIRVSRFRILSHDCSCDRLNFKLKSLSVEPVRSVRSVFTNVHCSLTYNFVHVQQCCNIQKKVQEKLGVCFIKKVEQTSELLFYWLNFTVLKKVLWKGLNVPRAYRLRTRLGHRVLRGVVEEYTISTKVSTSLMSNHFEFSLNYLDVRVILVRA